MPGKVGHFIAHRAYCVLLQDMGRTLINKAFSSEADAELYIDNLSGGYDAFTVVRQYPPASSPRNPRRAKGKFLGYAQYPAILAQ